MLAGDRQALARLITLVERDAPEVPALMKAVQPHLHNAYVCGFTGPPGSGKSTLVDRLVTRLRQDGQSVGVVAVDPSSPFSGGAMLGDRIRMQQHYLDDGVFIRSMALRNSHGGLPRTVSGVVKLLDAAGMDMVLVETVGVGQAELDIIRNSDTVVVLLTPEAGDPVQGMKAGLLEVADILVVNKADRPGAAEMVATLEGLLALYPHPGGRPPVLTTEAISNVGVDRLLETIRAHRRCLEESGQLEVRRRQQRRSVLLKLVTEAATGRIRQAMTGDEELRACLEKVERGELDPYSAFDDISRRHPLIRRWLE